MSPPLKTLVYIGKTIVTPFVLCFIGFFALIIIFQLRDFADLLFQNASELKTIADIFGLLSISYMPIILPFCILFGIVFGYGKLSSDSELTAFSSFGLSKFTLALPALALALVTSYVCFSALHTWGPQAKFKSRSLSQNLIKKVAASSFQPGIFITKIPGVVIYAETKDAETAQFNKLFVMTDIKDKTNANGNDISAAEANEASVQSLTILAKSGHLISNKKNLGLELQDGEVHHSLKKSQHVQVKFDSYVKNLSEKEQFENKIKTVDNLTTKQILKNLKASPTIHASDTKIENLNKDELEQKLKEKNTIEKNNLLGKIEYHKRNMLSLICIIFAVFGILFSLKLHTRSTRASGALASLVLSIAFWVLVFGAEYLSLSRKQHLIMYAPLIGFLLIILAIVWRNKKKSIV